jgi:hypothetical protein
MLTVIAENLTLGLLTSFLKISGDASKCNHDR